MIRSRSRTLACSLAVLVGLLQPLLSSPARAVAVFASHGHAHEVSVLQDSGHVDLVLTHAASAAPEQHGAEQHLHASPANEGAHVVHLTGVDTGRDSARRTVDHYATSSTVYGLHGTELLTAVAAKRECFALAPALVRSVVLRI